MNLGISQCIGAYVNGWSSEVSDPDQNDETRRDIEGSLREFVTARRTGKEPMGEVHGNIMALAMVEAAMASA